MINLILLFIIPTFYLLVPQEEEYIELRSRMVRDQIISRGIQNPLVVGALKKVQRHLFVPEDLTERAYQDNPLPIGYGQTISQPYIVAFMTEIINPQPGFKVLEIGTGSGYQAAVLSEIVSEVYTIEIISELASQVKSRMEKLDYKNVRVKNADGYFGWAEEAPFDAIIVTAAAEHIPPPLIEQLKNGGKMIIPVGSPFLVQSLILVNKSENKITTDNLMAVRFVPFKRASD